MDIATRSEAFSDSLAYASDCDEWCQHGTLKKGNRVNTKQPKVVAFCVALCFVASTEAQTLRPSTYKGWKGYVLETGRIVLEGDTKEIINNEFVKKAYLGG